jgi:leucyl aminopeptidase (aminopeptidase T)
VTIETWNNGLNLARKVQIEARRVGAHPILIFEDEDSYVDSVRVTPKDSKGKMGKHEYELLAATDAYFFIPNELLENYTKRLSPSEVDESTSYGDSWYDAAEKARLRGARMSFGFAGKELARMLGKKLDDIVIHQLKATLVDFESLSKTGSQLGEKLSNDSVIELDSGGSKLQLELEGGFRVEDGIVDEQDVSRGYNMGYLPPGLISKSVKLSSVHGKVKLSPSFTSRGVVSDAVLEFEGGQLVKWSSKSSKEKLDAVIKDQPEDERKINSLTLGFNPVLRYGYGEDRFVGGAIGISGLEFTGIVRGGTLRSGETVLINKGKLTS